MINDKSLNNLLEIRQKLITEAHHGLGSSNQNEVVEIVDVLIDSHYDGLEKNKELERKLELTIQALCAISDILQADKSFSGPLFEITERFAEELEKIEKV